MVNRFVNGERSIRLTDLKNRGLEDIFVACIDALSCIAEATGTKFAGCARRLALCAVIALVLAGLTRHDARGLSHADHVRVES